MKGDQVTLRLPRELARLLARRARELGVAKSQVVREALSSYLAFPAPPAPGESWTRVKHMVGSLQFDPQSIDRDRLAQQIRDHNWRD